MPHFDPQAVLAAHPTVCEKHQVAILLRALAQHLADHPPAQYGPDIAAMVSVRARAPGTCGDSYYLDDPVNRALAPSCPACRRAQDARDRAAWIGDPLAFALRLRTERKD